jgi:CubicO group peptidase (beta-lactamase class C family)
MDISNRVKTVMDNLIGRGIEQGLQVAAYLDGELVVDTWAGIADASTGRLVDGETLFPALSVTKVITATVIHLLAERGLLDYDAPVARYWPEFGINGKQGITLRQVLAHTAGVPQVPDGIGWADVSDWDRVCRAVAELTPLWEPGTATGYHAVTFGWILGEVAQRVDGRPFAAIVQEDVCRPLGITSLYIGIPDEIESRVAQMEPGSSAFPPPPPDALIWRAIPDLGRLHEHVNSPQFRRAVVPAANGIMNARSLARFCSALACGEPDGVWLLSPERIRIATTLQTADVDLATGRPTPKALGYRLGEPLSAMSDRLSAFGYTGAGGSFGFADPQYRLAFGFTKNRMVSALPGEDAAYLIAREVRAALGIPEAG